MPRPILVLDAYLQDRSVGRYGFSKRLVTVGRSPDSDLRLDHPGISRNHFRIERKGSTYLLQDCRSSNGTFVNRQRVSSHPLHEGDEVKAGKYSIRVSLREDSEYDGDGLRIQLEGAARGIDELATVRAPHLRGEQEAD